MIEFSNALQNVVNNITTCPHCGIFIDSDKCPICDDESRDKKTLLVVSDVKNVISFEKTNKYNGLYFVLGGCISPIKNISPEDIRIPQLLKNIKENNVKEIILALSSKIEGETTALFLAKLLAKRNIETSRIANGLPIGSNIDYADELTLLKSLEGRKKI